MMKPSSNAGLLDAERNLYMKRTRGDMRGTATTTTGSQKGEFLHTRET